MTPELQATAIRNYYDRVYGAVRPPATEQQIAAVEAKLSCRLPLALRALYLLCDGICYPAGDCPLVWVQMIPRETEAFREFAPAGKGKQYLCFGYEEGLRHLAIEIYGAGRVVSFNPSLEGDFCELGDDLLAAYKNLENGRARDLREQAPPEEYWRI